MGCSALKLKSSIRNQKTIVQHGCFFFHYFLATSMTNLVQIFTDSLLHAILTGIHQVRIPNVSSVFKGEFVLLNHFYGVKGRVRRILRSFSPRAVFSPGIELRSGHAGHGLCWPWSLLALVLALVPLQLCFP